jgi:hypothetical protein
MKTEKYSNQRCDSPELDAELRDLLQKELPRTNENPWFTQRVMNRLPDRSLSNRLMMWQRICYAISAVGIAVLIYIGVRWISAIELSLTNIVTIMSALFALIVCAGLMTVPSLIRILRE